MRGQSEAEELASLAAALGADALRAEAALQQSLVCLVVARALRDADYATFLVTGHYPGTGVTAHGSAGVRIAGQISDLRDRLGISSTEGRRAWPVIPWTAAQQLEWVRDAHGWPWRFLVYNVGWRRASGWDQLVHAMGLDRVAMLYVADRLVPRQTLLVVASDEQTAVCFDPERGGTVEVSRSDFLDGRLPPAGAGRARFLVAPTGKRAARRLPW